MIYFKIAIDCIIIGYDNDSNKLKILLTKRINEPGKGEWALPGGFINKTESFESAAAATLLRETGLQNVFLRQLKAYGLTDSSSTNRIASVAYYALLKYENVDTSKGQQLSEWFHFKALPSLPFDHEEKVMAGIASVKELVKLEPVIYYLLPEKFPLNQLQRFYEELYSTTIDNRNFRKKMLNLPHLQKLNEYEKGVSHRPGALFRFDLEKYSGNRTLY